MAISSMMMLCAAVVAQGPWYYEATGWKPGKYEWVGMKDAKVAPIVVSETDWSGYDRLSVDMVNEGAGGDRLYLFLGSPGTPHAEKRTYNTGTPDRCFKRWVVPLEGFAKSVCISNMTSVAFSSRKGRTQKLHLSNIRLLKKGEDSGGGTYNEAPADRPDLKPLVARVRAEEERLRGQRHAASLAKFAADCTAAGTVRDGVLFGQASPMTRVMPRDAFAAKPATDLRVRLARNEKEAVQLLVAPTAGDLKGVRVSVSDLVRERPAWKFWERRAVFAASNVQAKVMGYSELVRTPDYTSVETVVTTNGVPERVRCPMAFGWYPEPILDFLDGVDIAKGDVQGFWIDVRCPADQPAGTYRGTLRVRGEKGGERKKEEGRRKKCEMEFPLTVRVNDFALPSTPPVPMNISFKPSTRSRKYQTDMFGNDYYADERALRADKENAANLARQRTWEWADFLADHLVTIDYLYPAVGPRWDALVRLKKEGRLDHFNLKYWTGNSNNDDWFKDARERYAKAKELGLLDHAVFYGMDELHKEHFPKGAAMIERLKREFPGVTLCTTCKDKTYGCGSPLKGMDVFIPLTVSYVPANCAKARAEGRKVGWYVCGGGDDPVPNFFFTRQPIESRMMMGATAVKYRPDWFLYYEIAIWDSHRPITRGPFTDWSPESWTSWSGDGNLTACGPGGKPLSTQRLENFRDGLEDYHYAKILEARGGRAVVPDSLVTSLSAFSDDPDLYYAWRDAMADEIERRRR